jgi:hypothetical protein
MSNSLRIVILSERGIQPSHILDNMRGGLHMVKGTSRKGDKMVFLLLVVESLQIVLIVLSLIVEIKKLNCKD